MAVINPGSVVAGRYVVGRLIGEGGMGNVYEAQHAQIGKRVALKVLHKSRSFEAKAVRRFLQEAKIAGNIGHPNICEVFDFGTTDEEVPFIVMEYLEGESLREVIRKRGRLTVAEARDILDQVLDALEEVHGRGIVHRDLKPENIFITRPKGKGGFVKLLDFGISKMIAQQPGSAPGTTAGETLGTVHYMSPEIVRGDRAVDQRADIYACGVILFELTTGSVPFDGGTFYVIFSKILDSAAPDPRTFMPDLPPPFVELLLRCLEKDPGKRPQSAAELRDLLGLAVEGKALPSPAAARKAAFRSSVEVTVQGPPRGECSREGGPAAVPAALGSTIEMAETIVDRSTRDHPKGVRPRHLLIAGGLVLGAVGAVLAAVLGIGFLGEKEPSGERPANGAGAATPLTPSRISARLYAAAQHRASLSQPKLETPPVQMVFTLENPPDEGKTTKSKKKKKGASKAGSEKMEFDFKGIQKK